MTVRITFSEWDGLRRESAMTLAACQDAQPNRRNGDDRSFVAASRREREVARMGRRYFMASGRAFVTGSVHGVSSKIRVQITKKDDTMLRETSVDLHLDGVERILELGFTRAELAVALDVLRAFWSWRHGDDDGDATLPDGITYGQARDIWISDRPGVHGVGGVATSAVRGSSAQALTLQDPGIGSPDD